MIFSHYRNPNANRVALAVLVVLTVRSHVARALCVYNTTGVSVEVSVSPGNFSRTLDPYARVNTVCAERDTKDCACCHYSNGGCFPGGEGERDAIFTVKFTIGDPYDYEADIRIHAGGYAHIYARPRDQIAPGAPPNFHCESYHWDHSVFRRSNYGVYDTSRDVHFLVSADCQYDNGYESDAISREDRRDADGVNEELLRLLQNDWSIRGILYAGDLTQNARLYDEFAWYKDSISGFTRFVFDGLGNHDLTEPDDVWQSTGACVIHDTDCVDPDAIREDIRERKRATVKTGKAEGDAPHYSWDWHDVHFVQLNLFPGNAASAGNGDEDLQPHNSLEFLIADLASKVGSSGRPVVLVHHYGFDCFSKGDSACNSDATIEWWTEAERNAYWNAIAGYNVAAIFTGHHHLSPRSDESSWHIVWNGIHTFVAAAALNGMFLDVQMNSAGEMLVTRKDRFGASSTTVCVFGGSIIVDGSAAGTSTLSTIAAAMSAAAGVDPSCLSGSPIDIEIAAGNYPENLTLDQHVRLLSTGGLVRIGN